MKRFVLTTAICLGADGVFANGGGYSRGGVAQVGTVTGFEPSETEKVHIVNELLSVELHTKEAIVEVRYVLKNTSGKRADVRLGFPVEELKDENPFAPPADPAKPEPKTNPQLQYCRDYKIDLGGKALAATFEAEPENQQHDKRFDGIKGWLVSKLTLAPGEEKTMRISYRSDYPMSEESISEDVSESDREFKYRLSTGACWQGPIEHGSIIIRPATVDPRDVKILRPLDRFHKEANNWVWNFDNLRPTLADDIVVQAAPVTSTFSRPPSGAYGEGQRVDFVQSDGRWSIVHTNYGVKASSTLPPANGKKYDAANVKNGGGCWSEGASGPGIGEWLELTPEVPKPLSSIRINTGYGIGATDLFKANNRPKLLQVTLNDEHSFEAPLDDTPDSQKIAIIGYEKPVKTIRLTIEDVYKGSRFDDCCISRIALENPLSKKPKVTPAR